nr:MAG TPA: hypothetical protein [Caudoviricetes sp.]
MFSNFFVLIYIRVYYVKVYNLMLNIYKGLRTF